MLTWTDSNSLTLGNKVKLNLSLTPHILDPDTFPQKEELQP